MSGHFKPAINQGIILGVIGILIHLLIYALMPDLFVSDSYGLFAMITLGLALPTFFMIKGTMSTKPSFTFFSFGSAFKSAFYVGVISLLISFVYSFMFNNLIDTEFESWMYDAKMEIQMDKMEDKGVSEEMLKNIEENSEVYKKYSTGIIGNSIMHTIFLIWYTILALLVGAIQKDKKTEEDLLV